MSDEFRGRHDPFLVPAWKFGVPEATLWKWWCPCGKGGKSPDDYVHASRAADDHVKAKAGK